jgi:transposase
MHFVGLDYHTKSSYVSILNEGNEKIWDGRLRSDSELAEFVGKLDDTKVLFEAGYGWPRLVKLLKGSGAELVMCHPEHNRRIAKDRRKSDRRDADNLAVYLKAGGYKPAYMPEADVRDERQLIRGYINLSRRITMIKNQIHSLLAYAGVPKEGFNIFTTKSRQYLETVEVPEYTRKVLDANIEVLDFHRDTLKRIDEAVKELNRSDKRARLLKTIPGVGDFTARVILAEIGDVSRFQTDKSLACYVGLTQRQHQSSDTRRTMGITKEGSSHMRWVLVQAAWIAIRLDPALMEVFERIKAKKNGCVAICAVARKLTLAVWHILTSQAPYKARRPEAKGKPAVARGKVAAVSN